MVRGRRLLPCPIRPCFFVGVFVSLATVYAVEQEASAARKAKARKPETSTTIHSLNLSTAENSNFFLFNLGHFFVFNFRRLHATSPSKRAGCP